MTAAAFILVVHLLSTSAMFGVILFVQVVHYPLFARVGGDGFAEYCRFHQRLTTLVVAPLMLAEALSGLLLLWIRPPGIPPIQLAAALAALALIWASTALLQIPRHRVFLDGWDAPAHRQLVRTNWLRTALWAFRMMIVGGWAVMLLSRASAAD